MKMLQKVFLLIFLVGCVKAGETSTQKSDIIEPIVKAVPGIAEKGAPFELRPGESKQLPQCYFLSFIKVKTDSRCPKDAICVWAGQAVVILAWQKEKNTLNNFEIIFSKTEAEKSFMIEKTKVEISKLLPEPPPKDVKPNNYIATFTLL